MLDKKKVQRKGREGMSFAEKLKLATSGRRDPRSKEIKKEESTIRAMERLKEDKIKIEDTLAFKTLYEYRLRKGEAENISEQDVFTDCQLVEIIRIMPKHLHELREVSEFSKEKYIKYGIDIVGILERCRERSGKE